MGGFAYVFRAIRKHDQKELAIKRSRDQLDLLEDSIQQAMKEEIRLMK
jgi:hypothetical protein